MRGKPRMRRAAICAALILSATLALPEHQAAAASLDELRDAFNGFVAAQNAHDLRAVEGTLLPSMNFLWITRGTPIWGTDAALKRFAALYQGTWRLDPEIETLKIMMIGDNAAQLFVPITFTIGTGGQPAQTVRFLMNQILVKTPQDWRVSSILPIPAPPQ